MVLIVYFFSKKKLPLIIIIYALCSISKRRIFKKSSGFDEEDQ